MQFLIAFICFISLTSLLEAKIAESKLKLIDELITTKFIPSNHIPGFGVSIVVNNEVVLSKGYGYQSVESKTPVSTRTLFSVGSISKSIAATLTVKVLHEKFGHLGEAALDTPIVKLAPGFNFTLRDRYRGEQTSIRDILAHRTCLLSTDLDVEFGTVSTAEYTFRARYEQEFCTFRTKLKYNNALVALLGQLIAHIANKPIETLTMDFLKSIGMKEVTYVDSKESYLKLATMSSAYYRKDDKTHLFNSSLIRRAHLGISCAGILASVVDMAKYVSFHLNGGKVGTKQIIPEDVMDWLYQSAIHYEEPWWPVMGPYGYGLGFTLALHNGNKYVRHGGYMAPFHSYISLMHDKHIGIFTSANGPGLLYYGLGYEPLHSAIHDIILSEKVTKLSDIPIEEYMKNEATTQNMMKGQFIPFDIPYFHKPSTTESKIFTLDKISKGLKVNKAGTPKIKDLLGQYGNANLGDLIITSSDGKELQLKFGEWGIGKMIAKSGTSFSVKWLTDIDQHYLTYGPIFPVPVVTIDFRYEKIAMLVINDDKFIPFVKDKTLDKEAVIPWPADSCG